ncbi:hypothetical protein LIER_39239 [Lithospermum erythrorhizon]|uniref:Uncharacterized protein n=1 Tax=Lithospermum erythrorhizon TaxID=34254 RepID=A0AAV3QH70_LITER
MKALEVLLIVLLEERRPVSAVEYESPVEKGPTSGSQEFIAVVGSAQHKSLACCIAYRQGPGKRNSELLNAPPALGTTIREFGSNQTKGFVASTSFLVVGRRESRRGRFAAAGFHILSKGTLFIFILSLHSPNCTVSVTFQNAFLLSTCKGEAAVLKFFGQREGEGKYLSVRREPNHLSVHVLASILAEAGWH